MWEITDNKLNLSIQSANRLSLFAKIDHTWMYFFLFIISFLMYFLEIWPVHYKCISRNHMENKISAFLKSFLLHVICMSKRRPYQEIHLSQLNASDVVFFIRK